MPADCLQAEPLKMQTIEQVAESLQVSARDVAKLIVSGALGYCRIAGKVRIHPQCVQDYTQRTTVKPYSRP